MKGASTKSTAGAITHPDFSLAVAARALAASTVSYLEPHSRGLTFAAYDAIVKDTLLPPFSEVVPVDRLGRDISSEHGDGSESAEQALEEGNDQATKTNDKKITELQTRFSGDYELYEKYDRSGKQKVRCLIAVVHGRVAKKGDSRESDKDTVGVKGSVKDLEYIPGSISMTFRGTDTLENVIADVKAIALPYDRYPPYDPSKSDQADQGAQNEFDHKKIMKGATVHHGFQDAWYGDDLRQTVLQYVCDKIEELHRETQEAQHVGLAMSSSNNNRGGLQNMERSVPIVDIVGHSLGGSIAVLAAFDLACTLHCINKSNHAHIRVYTMGCPRVGNVAFTKLFNKLVPDCYNVINDNDIVPAIPHSPSALQSRLPVFCSCNQTWYRRHGRAVILKENGNLLIDPSSREKYRREAKVLRLKKAVDSHKTSNYRDHIRAAIQNEIHGSKQTITQMKHGKLSEIISSWTGHSGSKNNAQKEEAGWEALDDLLVRLEQVIVEARSDPTRSFHLLPGGT